MANFKICLRTQNGGGLFPVYIRVTHKRQVGYIKTDKSVSKEGIKKGEVIDPYVLSYCSKAIIRYNESLNALNLESMTVSEIVRYLKSLDDDISFSDYAQKYIRRMAYEWKMVRNSVSYGLAIQSLENFMNTDNILCAQLTTKVINSWIADLDKKTHRAKEHYPICVRIMFRAALDEFNDLEKGIVRIKNDPFKSVKIPKADTPEKRAVDVSVLKQFFSGVLPPSKMIAPLPELSRDVAEMVFCLAGMNTADLYELKKENYRDGKLCYQRLKTKKFRRDGAYLEITVPSRILPLFEKYKSENEYLFCFNRRYQDLNTFNINVNSGLKPYCTHNGLPPLCIYSFRHSWATIAQNVCGASTEDVGFALNHSSAHRVTDRYIKKDYTRVTTLNEKVLDVVFGE